MQLVQAKEEHWRFFQMKSPLTEAELIAIILYINFGFEKLFMSYELKMKEQLPADHYSDMSDGY